MPMQKKVFLAEKSILNAKHGEKAKKNETVENIEEMFNELKTEIAGIREALTSSISQEIKDTDDIRIKNAKLELDKAILETEKYRNETAALKAELTDLSTSIQQTKNEIAALSPQVKSPDNITAVSFELDEIVKSTEQATQNILDNAEKIETIAGNIAAAAGGSQVLLDWAQELSDTVIGVYESCNFQDLTGQRINKVVKVLKFIDEKITNMISIWGEETIAELAEKVKEKKTGDEKLLNGPALSHEAISQDDIDKFFS